MMSFLSAIVDVSRRIAAGSLTRQRRWSTPYSSVTSASAGPSAFVKDLLHAAGGIGVEHENLAEVSMRGLEQVKAVALGLGKRLLVTEDDLLCVVVKLAKRDESAALFYLVGARDLEALGVGEDAGVLFLDQDALLVSRR